MIIISQDKKTIINFKGITRVSIVPPVEKGYKYSIAINGCLDLGYYETEERAKEVLEEIVKQYEYTESIKLERAALRLYDNFIYRMPKE